MPKIYTGRHAELLGSTLVEPGGQIPTDADKDTVKRLEAEGKVADVKTTTTKEAEG